MKFKLGLIAGAGIGYLVGSGKGAELIEAARRPRHEELLEPGVATAGAIPANDLLGPDLIDPDLVGVVQEPESESEWAGVRPVAGGMP